MKGETGRQGLNLLAMYFRQFCFAKGEHETKLPIGWLKNPKYYQTCSSPVNKSTKNFYVLDFNLHQLSKSI